MVRGRVCAIMACVAGALGCADAQACALLCAAAEKDTGKQVQPVFISIDPERDSVKQVRDYVKGALCWNTHGLRGVDWARVRRGTPLWRFSRW